MRPVAFLLATTACGRLAFDGGGDAGGPADVITTPAPSDIWFKLDETSGQRVTDSAGDSHGWVYNPADSFWDPAGGVAGGAHRFAGTAYASMVVFPSSDGFCPVIPIYTSSVTVAAWVKFEVFGTWDGYTLSDIAVMHGSMGGSEGGWGIGASDGCGAHVAAATVAEPDMHRRAVRCGTTPLVTDRWYHIAGVYDADAQTLDVYLDGALDNGGFTPNSVPVPSALPAEFSGCPLLGASANQNNLLRGSLDDVRIFQRALPAAEIASIHAANGG